MKRQMKRQIELFDKGLSKTLYSKHLYGKAVDIMIVIAGKENWDFTYYKILAKHIKNTAKEMGIKIIWGGEWKSLKDGVHFELKE